MDGDAQLNPGQADGLNISFFMNLKIDDEQEPPRTSAAIRPALKRPLKTDTVITFEVSGESTLTKNITGVRVIAPPAPAPAYLTKTTVGNAAGALWSASSYALDPDGTNHFQKWVVPNDFMNTGDTFTVKVSFDDGTTGVYSRMINYVFKSIPKLINWGSPGALGAFNGPGEIVFDGTQDLVLEWAAAGR